MKKLYTLLALVITIITFAQAPQGFNYQATVRNSAGDLIVNQNVNFKFNIILNSATSVPVFSETQSVLTDDVGQVNLIIGQGIATTGTFSSINWGNGNYYLGIELNTGSGYVTMGTTQLLSVPFALYANSSGSSNSNFPNGTNIGDRLNWIWNGNAWIPTPSSALIPQITTTLISAVTNSTASSGGVISNGGGDTISGKGVCWSTSPNPTIALTTKTNNGIETTTFTSNITGLLPITTYYIRAYATNSFGTAYGQEEVFTTSATVIPQITTTIISAITSSSASSGGTISSSGGATITVKGVCWSTSPDPTIILTTKTNNGTGTTTFMSNITGLSPVITYYVRAYATNSVGTSYGQEEVFTTLAELPSLTTTAATSITGTTASSGGIISSDGGAPITDRGIVWSTSTNPTIITNQGLTSDGTGLGSFTSAINQLTPSTLYYVRAYATNSFGTAYGNLLNFQTSLIPGTVQTFPVTSITSNSATCGWNITDLGSGQLLNGYLIWSLTPNPTLDAPNNNQYANLNLTYTHTMNNLLPNTTYYVRSALISGNTNNIGYGDVKVFTTL